MIARFKTRLVLGSLMAAAFACAATMSSAAGTSSTASGHVAGWVCERVRVVTVNSVPFVITSAPYALQVCGLPICLGLNDVFNYTSLSSASVPPTPRGYNDVTGLGVPYMPKLINEE